MPARGCGPADTLEGDGPFTVFVRSNEAALRKRMGVKSVGGPQLGITYNFITGVRIDTPDPVAHVQNSDVGATNGVIHVIDRVIMPER